MAPALVELSAAKERNSTSKEYSKFRTYLSKLNLLDKFEHPYLPILNSFGIKSLSVSLKDPSYLEMNNSDKEDRQNVCFSENKNNLVLFKDAPIVTELKGIAYDEKVGYKNGTCNYKLDNMPLSEVSQMYSENTTRQVCNTTEERSPQPVAGVALDNCSMADYIYQKKDSCGLKFFDLNRSVNRLNLRLRRLQSKNVSSHVASHIVNENVHENLKAHKSTDTKHKNEISPRSCLQTAWVDLQKVHAMVGGFKNDYSDGEDELEIRQKVSMKCKRKSDNPPPPPEALHQWKVKRAHIGSQCSWLNLKISSLDKKIIEIEELHQKHKLERKLAKTNVSSSNHSHQTNLDTLEVVLNLTQPTNCIQSTDVAQPIVDEQISQRVLPYIFNHHHKYIQSCENTNIEEYGCCCRCLPSISLCRLCLHLQKHPLNEPRHVRIGKLDHSYHSVLSFESDVSLSFLLEETLRKKRINTKVTISKSTKKKKKLRIKECDGHELSAKEPSVHKSLSPTKLSSDKDPVKSKGDRSERQKYDEISRKRSTGLDPPVHTGGRTRKLRKLSESEESWKPSTPTSELNSPFSQSLPSSAFFPLKNRKRSGGSEYDINNIVIPYSMAAATRVERIQYKEIPTPGWRNINISFDGRSGSEECEDTEDECYLERHGRCELNERKKFTDYFRPVLRRQRPYHLSESTASGPPSPLISEEFRHTINTPIDSSPVINPSTGNSRVVNVVVVPQEEREPCWATRTYPLNENECVSLCTIITSVITASSDNTSKPVLAFNNSDSSKYPISSLTTVCDSVRETLFQTPLHTPIPSPLCSQDGISPDGGEQSNPDNWTVKVMNGTPLDVLTTESQRAGIVLKLAKK